jgi:UDP-4-amino-4,6-dideoxy-N-acetyl-beta-L-altrosamine transaminase
MIPYSRQDVSEEDIQAVCDVLRSDFLTQGPTIDSFERAFAARHEVTHAVAVTNATAGLQIACMALGAGVGTRVWTSPNSFVASANCALHCGATIDFVDIDPRTRNMSLEALQEKLTRTERAGALPQIVIPVDFAGLPCDLREIRVMADRYGFKILEDASHATGASYLGKPTGSSFADATVFSFHAVKIVTTAEGGIITTRDALLADRLRALRSHGTTRNPLEMERACEGAWYYEQQSLGFNFRMTEVQAALGLSQLARLDVMRQRREALAARYDLLLGMLPVLRPARFTDRHSSWHLYAIEVDEARTLRTRAQVFDFLRNAGIGVNVHYIPIHTQPFYARLGFRRGDYPASEHYYSRAISIPLFPALTEEQQDRIVDALTGALT